MHTTEKQVSEKPTRQQGDPHEVGNGPEFGSSELKCKSNKQFLPNSANVSQPREAEHKYRYKR